MKKWKSSLYIAVALAVSMADFYRMPVCRHTGIRDRTGSSGSGKFFRRGNNRF